MTEEERKLISAISAATLDERAEMADRDRSILAAKKDAVDKLALESFGIAPGYSDGISAAHPALAGVIRRALRDAFDAGVSGTARIMLQSWAEQQRKGR